MLDEITNQILCMQQEANKAVSRKASKDVAKRHLQQQGREGLRHLGRELQQQGEAVGYGAS